MPIRGNPINAAIVASSPFAFPNAFSENPNLNVPINDAAATRKNPSPINSFK